MYLGSVPFFNFLCDLSFSVCFQFNEKNLFEVDISKEEWLSVGCAEENLVKVNFYP